MLLWSLNKPAPPTGAGEPAKFLAAPAPAPRGQKIGSGSWLLVKFAKNSFPRKLVR